MWGAAEAAVRIAGDGPCESSSGAAVPAACAAVLRASNSADARTNGRRGARPTLPAFSEFAFAVLKIVFGAGLFWVYLTFIGLVLLSMGTMTFLYAPTLAAGEPLARALSVFLAVFWMARLVVAAVVLDVRPYLTNWYYRAGCHATTVTFIYLTVIYAWLALR